MTTLLLVLLTAFTNPILYADYSDPDVIRIGEKYYMTSSSFNCSPGLQILESEDMVHWEIIDAALPYTIPGGDYRTEGVQHGNQVWAPSIRTHHDSIYIYWGDPDNGIFRVAGRIDTTRKGSPFAWEEYATPILWGEGLIDPCPLWDEDGRCYLVHALAGSRCGHKSVLLMTELNSDGTGIGTTRRSRIIYDGHEKNPTCEGPKLYKRNGYYYIFTPAGGVPTGWQLVLRSKNIYGPYEEKVVLAQGKTAVNGPHQGAWVQTPDGADWFYHFQDVGALGRIVHLQPMRWVDDWPVIGNDADGDGCGEPVAKGDTHIRAKQKKQYNSLDGSDRFDGAELGPQWQWQAEPQVGWYWQSNKLRLYSVEQASDTANLWQQKNCLLQKPVGPKATMVARVSLHPDSRYTGERGGLVVMGRDYAAITLENTPEGIVLRQVVNQKADRNGTEVATDGIRLEPDEQVWLKVEITSRPNRKAGETDMDVQAQFCYAKDGKHYQPIGQAFRVREGKWIGAKYGLFCTRPAAKKNDGGWMDVYEVLTY